MNDEEVASLMVQGRNIQGGARRSRRRFVLASLSVLALSAQVPHAFSQNRKYPDKPVRIIVPLSAGSSGDVRVRLLAEKLSARLGQRFVVENKPGAGLTLGAALVANSKPDGYTLLATFTPSFTVGPILYTSAGYDAQKSFAPVASFAQASPLFAVHPSVPAKTIKEFVALARSKPGTLTVGHSGLGSGIHLPSELFRRAAKIDFVYVPYGVNPLDWTRWSVSLGYPAGARRSTPYEGQTCSQH